MKVLQYIYWLIVSAFLLGACQVNPLDEVEEGDWNKERRILGLLLRIRREMLLSA